jgi:Flp pilus assembly protein TadG
MIRIWQPHHPPRRQLHQRGVAAVELALLLAPMLVLLFGVTELGRALYTYNTLGKTVRDAARHLSQHGPGDSTVWAQARCLAVHGDTACSGPLLAPGLSTSQVSVCDAVACAATHANQATGQGVINLVGVTIDGYVFDSVLDLGLPGTGTFFGDRRLQPISATMRGPL